MGKEKAKKHPGGRPPKLTPETRTKVLTCLRGGAYLETAAAMAGVHRDTLRIWLIKGAERPNTPYGEFARDAEKAMAESELRDLTLIGTAAQTQWTAAAWRLERRFPERYALRTKVDNTHASPDGGPVQHEHTVQVVFVDAIEGAPAGEDNSTGGVPAET
jgi:transposase